jgi:predicted deacylase
MDEMGEAICRIYSPRVFALYQDGGPLPPITGSVTYQATRRGVVSVLTETGSAGGLDPADVQYRIRRIIDIMRYLKMLDGEPEVASGQLKAVTQFRVTARRGGLIRTDVKVGDELKAGQPLAEVVDVFGDVVERIEAPRDGIARIVWTHRVVNTGDPIVLCWVAEPAPPFPPLAPYTKP